MCVARHYSYSWNWVWPGLHTKSGTSNKVVLSRKLNRQSISADAVAQFTAYRDFNYLICVLLLWRYSLGVRKQNYNLNQELNERDMLSIEIISP
jgi:hypothetical protein